MKSAADSGLVASLNEKEEYLKTNTAETISHFQETIVDLHKRLDEAKDTIIQQVKDKLGYYEIAIENSRATLGRRF